jgi:hypothetical protein
MEIETGVGFVDAFRMEQQGKGERTSFRRNHSKRVVFYVDVGDKPTNVSNGGDEAAREFNVESLE